MININGYEEALASAKKKKKRRQRLNKSEKMALSEKWFFTVPLDISTYKTVIEMAKLMNIKPHDVITPWIEKEVSNKFGARE